MREPLSSLARADAVVLSGNLSPDSIPEFVKCRWRVQRSIFAPQIRDACVAFCGIARPEPFFSQLQQAGLNLVATQRFRDHHAYDASDMRKLVQLRNQNRASVFVTTEKDAINLGEHLRELGTVHLVSLQMELEEADAVVNEILARVNSRSA